MNNYRIMPEGSRWTETTATSAEMAYRSICSWYGTKTRIAVMNTATGEMVTFTRQLDKAGNLVEVVKE